MDAACGGGSTSINFSTAAIVLGLESKPSPTPLVV